MFGDCSGDKISFVKESLFKFITSRIPNADLSVIDDIILSYVYSTFEGGSEEFYSQLNDVVADFADMMSAYVNDFSSIERNDVCNWMIEIVHCLDEMNAAEKANDDQGIDEARALDIGEQAIADAASAEKQKKSRSSSTSDDEKGQRQVKAYVFFEDEYNMFKCKRLHEMFPHTNPMEVKHCITIAFGDIDDAASALLHRRDSGQALECNAWAVAAKVETVDEDEIKHRIITRYSYVDKESETKEHKPLAPKHAPKKMVRYRDNKIVSLKGERYTEVQKSDEDGVKKSNKKQYP